MTYNVFGGTLNFAQSINPKLVNTKQYNKGTTKNKPRCFCHIFYQTRSILIKFGTKRPK